MGAGVGAATDSRQLLDLEYILPRVGLRVDCNTGTEILAVIIPASILSKHHSNQYKQESATTTTSTITIPTPASTVTIIIIVGLIRALCLVKVFKRIEQEHARE